MIVFFPRKAVTDAVSHDTVSQIIQRAEELGITWPLDKNWTDGELRQRLFAGSNTQPPSRKHPDYEYVQP